MYAIEFTRRLSQALIWGSVVAALIVLITG